MKEPRWLNVTMILAIHSDQIQQHGGSLGLRDRGLLDSALARRRNRYHYESAADLVDLAAAYGFAIARNHPFVDGNKRVAFQAMYVFLAINGLRIDAEEPEVVRAILALAAGEMDEIQLSGWLRDHTSPR